MICNKCGTENADDAVFCKSCGSRLDGKIICPSCGKEIEADAVFCGYCGKRIAGEQTVISKNAVTAQKSEAAAAVANPSEWKKVLKIIASAMVLVTAVISLIFVFCMGVKETISAFGYGSQSEDTYLYYFFGKAYENLDSMFSAMDGVVKPSTLFSASMYFPVVLGTIVSAVTLILVLSLSITAMVFSIKSLAGKSENNGARFAVASFLSFVVGASLLLALSNSNMSSGLEGSMYVNFNAATLTGIILGAITIAVYAGCMIALRGKQLLNAGVIVKLVLSFVLVVFIGVIMGLLSAPAYGLSGEDVVGGSVNVGLTSIMMALGLLCIDNSALRLIEDAGAVYAINFFAILVLAILLIFAAALLARVIRSITDGNYKSSSLGFTITTFVLAAAFMTFTIVCGELFIKTVEGVGGAVIEGTSVDEFSLTYAVPIVIFVFSALSLAVSITNTVLSYKFVKTPSVSGSKN